MNYKILALLGAAFVSTSAFAMDIHPKWISCTIVLDGTYSEHDFTLADYTRSDGSIDMNEALQFGQTTVEVRAFRSIDPKYSGSLNVQVSEFLGVYSAKDVCAGGGCPPAGTPKKVALLGSESVWQLGKDAMTTAYAQVSGDRNFTVSCRTKE